MFFRFSQGFLFRRPTFIFKGLVQPELMGDGQIHEAHREGLAQAVPQGLPFRGELGERVEDGAAGIVGSVHEQSHRGAHPRFEHERQHGFPVRWPFDQQAVGLHFFQSPQQAAGAPRPVVADAEKSNGLIRHGEAFCKMKTGGKAVKKHFPAASGARARRKTGAAYSTGRCCNATVLHPELLLRRLPTS